MKLGGGDMYASLRLDPLGTLMAALHLIHVRAIIRRMPINSPNFLQTDLHLEVLHP